MQSQFADRHFVVLRVRLPQNLQQVGQLGMVLPSKLQRSGASPGIYWFQWFRRSTGPGLWLATGRIRLLDRHIDRILRVDRASPQA